MKKIHIDDLGHMSSGSDTVARATAYPGYSTIVKVLAVLLWYLSCPQTMLVSSSTQNF